MSLQVPPATRSLIARVIAAIVALVAAGIVLDLFTTENAVRFLAALLVLLALAVAFG